MLLLWTYKSNLPPSAVCRGHDPLLVDQGSTTVDINSAAIWIWTGQGNLPTDLALCSILTANDLVKPIFCVHWIAIGCQSVLAANWNDMKIWWHLLSCVSPKLIFCPITPGNSWHNFSWVPLVGSSNEPLAIEKYSPKFPTYCIESCRYGRGLKVRRLSEPTCLIVKRCSDLNWTGAYEVSMGIYTIYVEYLRHCQSSDL